MSDKRCSVEGCQNAYRYSGYCNSHYLRQRRHGDPLYVAPRRTLRERFDSKVVKTDGCWEWSGGHFRATGYATFNVTTGRPGVYVPTVAHRIAWELYVGPIPDGLVIDHLCRNRGCVNPAHLEPVTQQTNMLRGDAPSAIAVRTNTCSRGHQFTTDNTYWRTRGEKRKRECRTCMEAREARRPPRSHTRLVASLGR